MNSREKFTSYKTIFRKEVLRFFSVWKQTLIPPVLTMTLYFIIFGTFIGSQVSNIKGFSYMQFIMPGLIMMPLITSSFSHTVFSMFMYRFQRTIDDILVSPTPSILIMLGFISAAIVRGVLVSFLVSIVALFFTSIVIHNIFVLFAFMILTSLVFSLAGFTVGLFAKTFDSTAIIPNFVLTPLTYLGGVFYSISLLPPFWQTLSRFNPILYMINGFRFGFLGITDVNLFLGIGILIIFIITLFYTNLYLMKKGVGLRT